MALKRNTKKPKSKKGVLLTLLTIIIFILMLGEVITYVVLNINYDNLSSSVAQSLSSSNFAQNLNSGMGAFLYSSLSKSLGALTSFESSPTTRNDIFINNSESTIKTLVYNGTLFNKTLYYNNSFTKALEEFQKEALDEGFIANLSNITINVKQASPFRIGAYITGLASLNTSSGITLAYPIDTNTTVSINSKPSLIAAEQGLNETFQKEQLPNATVVGNLTAVSGSTSPYMFDYGKVYYVSGEPTCAVDVPTSYQNGNYILATPNAADIGQNVCGMGGLITNISNSSTPLKPYLVYKNDSIMNYLKSDPSLLLYGPGLELLNTSAIQSGVVGGFYYASPYTASYLQRVEAQTYKHSPNGIFSFRSVDRQAANFTAPGQNITVPSIKYISGSSSATMSAWVYLRKLASHQIIFSDEWNSPSVLQMYIHANGALEADFGSGSWIDAAETNPGTIEPGKWYLVTATWSSGSGESISINGVSKPVTYIVGNSLSTGALGTPSTGNIAANQGNGGSFDGFIANLQIYNSSIDHPTIYNMYEQGIDSIPANESGLVAWYPLYSNANDYSGNGNNGVPTNVIYTGITGYALNPTGQQQQNYVSEAAEVNASGNGGLYAASAPFKYIGLNYTVSMWFTLRSALDPSDGGGRSPIIDIYNATSNGGVGGGQNYDFGGAWAGSTANNFGWGEYWPQNWQFCNTPNGVIKPGVRYNAIVAVHNYTNITVYID